MTSMTAMACKGELSRRACWRPEAVRTNELCPHPGPRYFLRHRAAGDGGPEVLLALALKNG